MNAPHQPGEIVADRYRIVETLGEGGNGITYKAESLKESHLEEGKHDEAQFEKNRYVALKALSLRQMEDWKPLELFEREARILQHLNHPSIPRYIDYFHVDTPANRAFYIVQELVEGQSLAAMVEKGWRTNEAGVRRIVIQVLEILVYLQDLKPPVIHRDIKPHNLIWGKDGKIFLVDFGAVRDTYHSTLARGSTVVGTFGYMAPEQFQGQGVPATDLYGLGATALFLLTHRSPAELPEERLKISFRSRVQISESFAGWLERVLEPDASDRFVSAREAVDLLQGKMSVPKPVSPSIPWKAIISFGILASIWIGGMKLFKYPFIAGLSRFSNNQKNTYLCEALRKNDRDTITSYFLWHDDVKEKSFLLLGCSNKVEDVEKWLDKGADIRETDDRDRTPLHIVENKAVATLLIERGIDVNAKTKIECHGENNCHGGETALHQLAQRLNGKEIVQLLLDRGADVNVKNAQGKTPLYEAVWNSPSISYESKKNEAKEIIELLISYGADVNTRTNKIYSDWDGRWSAGGETPLMAIVRFSEAKVEIVELLLSNGADVNARGSSVATPLDWAIVQQDLEMIRLLRAYGGKQSGRCQTVFDSGLSCR